ncbi:Uncharacterised protein [Segatella copri]|nr:Uncharacterised protein [Segatella copri]
MPISNFVLPIFGYDVIVMKRIVSCANNHTRGYCVQISVLNGEVNT